MDFKKILINEEFQNLNLIKARRIVGWGISELIATFSYVAFGCASMTPLLGGEQNSPLITAIAFAFGISLSMIVFGPISFCLMNPGLGLVMVILEQITVVKFVYYCILQLLGGYLGVLFIYLITPDLSDGFCMTVPNPEITILGAFLVEFWTSTLLGFGMCNVVDSRQADNQGLIFAKFFIIILPIAVASPKYAGFSINPARSLGPALLAWDWTDHWIYWAATMSGMALSAVIYRFVFAKEIYTDTKEPEKK